MSKLDDERREHDRHVGEFRLFVHIQQCEPRPEIVGKAVPCETADISTGGLQIKRGMHIPTGTLLNITVAIGRPFMMYLLEGEVRWDVISGETHRLGIKLVDRAGTDYAEWLDTFDAVTAWIELMLDGDI